MAYKKTIRITSTGMVVAIVHSYDGRRTGLEFFSSPFNGLERRCEKAHKWADNHIKICEKQEVIPR